MNKLSCILIDDEPSGRIVLRELLNTRCSDVVILDEAENVTEAYAKIKTHNPDFILLDIQMPGSSGFDLLRKFETVDFDVVFVTSYDKYAINAFKFSAIDYLLKPVEVSELVSAVEKVRNKKSAPQEPTNIILNLLHNMDHTAIEKKIAVHDRNKVIFIDTNQIVCIEAANNYSDIYTSDGQKYVTSRILKDFEEFIAEYKNFWRINRSAIVNLNYILNYTKGDQCTITLNNNMKYEVSRRKKIEMNELLRLL
ncbi:MAG: two component transcriptional regulator, LytTR family [Bacteroidetes bacterium]|jgi:two-component system LytT family response regulator|nr:two component transcriptional regulator, LytTR family [Bacteroidota bacterium]